MKIKQCCSHLCNDTNTQHSTYICVHSILVSGAQCRQPFYKGLYNTLLWSVCVGSSNPDYTISVGVPFFGNSSWSRPLGSVHALSS